MLFNSRELQMIFQNAKAKRMKSADIHFIDICRNIMLGEFVGDSGNQLFRRFFGESCNKNIFRLYIAFVNQVESSLNKRKSFSCTRSGSNQNSSVSGGICLPFAFVSITEVEHFNPSFTKKNIPARLSPLYRTGLLNFIILQNRGELTLDVVRRQQSASSGQS